MCHGESGGRNTAECAMGTLMVVAMTPVLEHSTHFAHVVEDVAVEHLGAHGSIEPFDQRVLRRFARLDEAQLDQVVARPLCERMTDELRPVVHTERWPATASYDILRFLYDLRRALTMAGETDPIAPRTWVAIDIAKGVNVAMVELCDGRHQTFRFVHQRDDYDRLRTILRLIRA